MSGDSRSHLNRDAQRRFRWAILGAFVVVILILTPLVINGDLRLDLAHRFDLVPGGDVEKLYDSDDGATLITVPIRIVSEADRVEYRFRSVFIAIESPDGVELDFVDDGERMTLPLEEYDFYSASHDGAHVLIQDTRDPGNLQGVLIDMETHAVTPMPAATPYPVEIPGDWETGSWETPLTWCGVISPHGKFITCFQEPKLATFLAGDWELQVRVFGSVRDVLPVYRGSGLRPWVGWSDDDSRLYFQNEDGIWVAPISIEMFS